MYRNTRLAPCLQQRLLRRASSSRLLQTTSIMSMACRYAANLLFSADRRRRRADLWRRRPRSCRGGRGLDNACQRPSITAILSKSRETRLYVIGRCYHRFLSTGQLSFGGDAEANAEHTALVYSARIRQKSSMAIGAAMPPSSTGAAAHRRNVGVCAPFHHRSASDRRVAPALYGWRALSWPPRLNAAASMRLAHRLPS